MWRCLEAARGVCEAPCRTSKPCQIVEALQNLWWQLYFLKDVAVLEAERAALVGHLYSLAASWRQLQQDNLALRGQLQQLAPMAKVGAAAKRWHFVAPKTTGKYCRSQSKSCLVEETDTVRCLRLGSKFKRSLCSEFERSQWAVTTVRAGRSLLHNAHRSWVAHLVGSPAYDSSGGFRPALRARLGAMQITQKAPCACTWHAAGSDNACKRPALDNDAPTARAVPGTTPETVPGTSHFAIRRTWIG